MGVVERKHLAWRAQLEPFRGQHANIILAALSPAEPELKLGAIYYRAHAAKVKLGKQGWSGADHVTRQHFIEKRQHYLDVIVEHRALSCRKIGKMLGLSYERVRQLRKLFNLPRIADTSVAVARRKIMEANREMSNAEISELLGVSTAWAGELRRVAGLKQITQTPHLVDQRFD